MIVKTDHIEHTDNMGSYRGALTYKPATNGSVYLAFGTSFNPSAEDLSLISSSRSFSLNNANLDPEKNRTYEFGTKWSLVESHLNPKRRHIPSGEGKCPRAGSHQRPAEHPRRLATRRRRRAAGGRPGDVKVADRRGL